MAHACTLIGGFAGGASTKAGISGMKFRISIEKQNRTYAPGDIIFGNLQVYQLPWNLEDICGIFLQLEGKFYNKSDEATKIHETRKYIVGSPWNKYDLKTGVYNFGIPIPRGIPCSFTTEKGGRLKYTLTCFANRIRDGFLSLRSEKVIYITSNPVTEWVNQEYLSQPTSLETQMSQGNVYVWLKTNRRCYQPGETIEFSIKVKNGGRKDIRSISLHLQQYANLKTSRICEKHQVVGVIGPSIDSNSGQVWSGNLKIPSEMPASIEQSGESQDVGIDFHYSLLITLQMVGYFVPSIYEEFPIQIGFPLAEGINGNIKDRATDYAPFQPFEILTGDGFRRMSMVSLTPSLPDYHTALLRAVLPPAYSTLDLQNPSGSATTP